VGDVEHSVAPPPDESKCCRADGREEDDADDSPDDIPVFDSLCQVACHHKEGEVKYSVQDEQEENDAAKDLM
jgi:hypothetical protein